MADLPPSQVKGVWFVSALDYARDLHGQEVVDRIIARTPEVFRDVYKNPIPSAWYPEQAFSEGLSVFYNVMAQGNDFMFEQTMEGCTDKGVNRVFRLLLRASSPSFVLRKVPTMWNQIRRGAGHVEVEQLEGESVIRYSEFPWFENPLYRMLTVASLRALVRSCTGKAPRVDVTHATRNSLTVCVAYKTLESSIPPVRFTTTRPPFARRESSTFPPSVASGSIGNRSGAIDHHRAKNKNDRRLG